MLTDCLRASALGAIGLRMHDNKGNVDRLFEGDAALLGDKAAQRINTIACAMLNKMNIEIFRKLETAYTPPIAPTLDVTTLVCDIIIMKMNRNQ